MAIAMVIFTLIGGIVLSAQSSVNGTLSRKAGTIETTLFTFITGSLFLALIILFFGQGNILAIMEAPKWQLSAVFLGVAYLLLTVIAVPRIGVIATNIGTIIGQLITGMIIDHFGWFGGLEIHIDGKRLAALAFMLIALYFVYKSNKRVKEERA
ncbi:hypothetical protein BEH_10900 [Priestia filamentosa]|uniref:Uncharacterized protein n=1 Tax=Priestia filamentosa TaxID=1402861 RepID=A0A1X7E7H8_9BACI|nr:DMT family transporter [Priestia filamentosa]AKO92551.1 hypothetical protein BEH_10900 [Priestia filamentosa]MDT3762623.1 DMT family transporter [Priestia filamentosa]OXS69162.1 hypothetical protein B1B01_09290 [Priestia filamentosa]WRU97087.1 DMT family transporter [Priestia filamentosa]SMF28931.1 transporter family-2 protein [Priestia filamentosa]